MTVKRAYRSPGRQAGAGQTRASLIAAATVLLGEGGKRPFSLEAVAQQAGVTRLTVYNHFESKAGLLEAVFDELAQRGGLFELPAVFAGTDPRQAVRRLVSIFCAFWASHRSILPSFRAVILSDDEIAERLRQRAERRRRGLTVLVGRMMGDAGQRGAELVDLLFALTSFEMFEALSVRNRRPQAVEAMLQELVDRTLARYIE